ncbi:DnaJ domain-containing protein [Halovivax gelatinilyticus]|uniref:DnaJ domain-containing protein n=1 Tax=Halovivax gelatinilyticus TaxID=2961597 RepID=UPI0020CA98D4|nr:DnaJ domain-containing protein [Halovivax gelatinilyticus]
MERQYEVLGLSTDASLPEVRTRYRRLLKRHHPDHGGSRAQFLQIRRAYEEITGESPPEDAPGSDRPPAEASDPTFVRDETASSTRRSSASGDLLSISLVAFRQQLPLSTLSPVLQDGVVRPVVFFEITNRTDVTLTWDGWSETSFVGRDGFMYQGSSVLNRRASALPGRWWPRKASLEPGRTLRAIVVAEGVPADVEVERVVYTQHADDRSGGNRQTERYLFEIADADAPIDELPFDVEAAR